jgi:3-deoxy-D-manno-octulosonic-acid transferase
VHNVLEAAVYGKPVFYGNNYRKYAEAVGLIEAGGAFEVTGQAVFEKGVSRLLEDPLFYNAASTLASGFVRQQAGATQKILSYIQEKRLLTN